jgi:hypothetical protein
MKNKTVFREREAGLMGFERDGNYGPLGVSKAIEKPFSDFVSGVN